MTFASHVQRSFVAAMGIAPVAALLFTLAVTFAQEKLTEPVYRVANETASATALSLPATGAVVAPAPKVAVQAGLDLTQKSGEHPLHPVIRALKVSQEEIDRNVRDYSCTLKKKECVNGQLGDYQTIFMKVMHEPFSVYMSFVNPFAGREVVYVDGQNQNKMLVLDVGFKRMLGKIPLDPKGATAMNGQKHPITDVGIKNLTAKLLKMWEAESQFAECDVTTKAGTKVEGRPTTMVQITHPLRRPNFKFHYARLFFDDELKIPIHFDAFLWPAKEGDPPVPEESYTYANLKVNNNFTGRDFDPNNNPEIFKK